MSPGDRGCCGKDSRWGADGVLLGAGAVIVSLALMAVAAWVMMVHMPGRNHRHAEPAAVSTGLAALEGELRADVLRLAGDIGERNLLHYERLNQAADAIEQALAEAGLRPHRQTFAVHGLWNYFPWVRRNHRHEQDYPCHNLEVEIPGCRQPDEIVVVGAHYDSVAGSPGANDNASGVAVLLALARRAPQMVSPGRTLRLVAFANEEPPFFQTEWMGSQVYARRCRQRGDNIVAMLSLETIGYYSDEPGSQQYPAPLGMFYPSAGNFIGVVGNLRSRQLVRRVVGLLRQQGRLPAEGAALPVAIPGVAWSDHSSFWQAGYPAVMLTDTAMFRYPHYHSPDDTPDQLDYPRMALLTDALQHVVAALVDAQRIDTPLVSQKAPQAPS